MRFAREPYSPSLVREMWPLWEAHHAETAAYRDIKVDPDFAVYANAEKGHSLRIFTVRQDDKLLGYQVFFVMGHPHSKHSVQAVQDILFLLKAHRHGFLGYRFIKWCGEELQKEGVQVVFQHISADHDFGRMLERMGYKHVDQVYGKRLDALGG